MKTKKTTLIDGAKVAYTHGQYGKKVAKVAREINRKAA